jgi:hypothetical protein
MMGSRKGVLGRRKGGWEEAGRWIQCPKNVRNFREGEVPRRGNFPVILGNEDSGRTE